MIPEQDTHLVVSSNAALALKIGERYFVRHGKRGRAITAWSLAGARLFLPNTTILDRTYTKLCQSGHRPSVVWVVECTKVKT